MLCGISQVVCNGMGQATVEKITYSRYPQGYDFTVEQEARIVTGEDDRDVQFAESEVLAIIVPDGSTKEMLKAGLDGHWSTTPKIFAVHPI